jgi:uncharacterized membrane protein
VIRSIFRWVAAGFFVVAGLNHFRDPAIYLSIMPPYLPWPRGLVLISGLAEALGGAGLLVPGLRRAAAWGLIALLVAVFPANIQMLIQGFHGLPAWVLWARLPFQVVFIAWIYWVGVNTRGDRIGN